MLKELHSMYNIVKTDKINTNCNSYKPYSAWVSNSEQLIWLGGNGNSELKVCQLHQLCDSTWHKQAHVHTLNDMCYIIHYTYTVVGILRVYSQLRERERERERERGGEREGEWERGRGIASPTHTRIKLMLIRQPNEARSRHNIFTTEPPQLPNCSR